MTINFDLEFSVSRQWSEFEDEALAHRLQNDECMFPIYLS